ncbi:MAG: hypothetical protein B6D59_04095 [Campylobacteraceae bacterium 4484_4]|nr:MAG: hypothetical protein B6D59_04095 [Campylobacteraceae bacterium 4484_4]
MRSVTEKAAALFAFIELVVTVFILIVMMRLFNRHIWQLRRLWSKAQQILLGYDVMIKGEPDPEAGLVLMNHQSLLDITVVDGIYPKNLSWVAKKEIRDIPFYGQIMSLPKMITIDREDRKSLVLLFKQAKARLAEGRVIAMFPEGTRGDGKTILPFKAGAKLLAEKLNLKVQPIVIVNTRYILDSKKFTAHHGRVVVVYLDAIDPKEDPEWFKKLHQKMQDTLTKELSQLSVNP